MRYGKQVVIAIGVGLICWLLVTGDASAHATACSTVQAKKQLQVMVAKRKAAERREAEARYVYRATRYYSSLYGGSVGRWVRLARRVGWPKAQMPTLMRVIYRESRGNPNANSGYYVGILQYGPDWVTGATDWRKNPRESLRRCLKSVREVGWLHWPTSR